MSEPQRHRVRVRRSPKILVFLIVGAAVGVLAAFVSVNAAPADPSVTTAQAIGFLALFFAPIGAVVAGVVALLIDRASERSARTVEAERIAPAPAARAGAGVGEDGDEPAAAGPQEDAGR